MVKTTVQKTVSVGSIPTFGQKDMRLELILSLKNLTFKKKFDIIVIEKIKDKSYRSNSFDMHINLSRKRR